jgi:23S rRNA (adenine2503-C2)-methyltransferase
MSAEEIISEIRFMTQIRFPDNNIPCEKFKIQFARMGEPTLNSEVLKVLEQLPKIYNAPGLMPCISTVAPKGGKEFLSKLITIKDQNYPSGNFQLQFSIHSTNEENRHEIMSPKIWNLEEISEYGKNWFKRGDRKITLNFALTEESIIDIDVLRQYFDPGLFFIKLTPLNPTNNALKNGYKSGITKENVKSLKLVSELRNTGYDAIVSIGEWEENEIGTNCGQFATELLNGEVSIKKNYTTSSYPF